MHRLCQDREQQQTPEDASESQHITLEDTDQGFPFLAGSQSGGQDLAHILLTLAEHDCSKLRKMALLTIMKIYFFDKDLFDKALQVQESWFARSMYNKA